MSTTTSAVSLHQGTFEVDGNGQALYRIPLVLPPGIGGFAPKLELSYSHRSPNGLLGVGWNLGGLSAISRTRPTYAVDGFLDAVAYGPNDRFALDGQRLINVQGAYGAGGTLYYTEVQTWQHVRAGATPEDGFVVVTKDGQTFEYGRTASSRILATGTNVVRIWALNAKQDRNGNRVEYSYVADPGGAYAIDSIRYTTRADLQPHYLIRFTYQTRPDVILDHIGGHPVTMSTRLASIAVSLSSGEIIRTYSLAYEQGNATGLSRVISITESGAQSAGSPQLPATTIVWQDVPTPGFAINPQSTLDQHLEQTDVRAMDLTGSGRTDFVQLWTDGSQMLHATTYIASTNGGQTTFVRAADTLLDGFPETRQILPMDVNGDGLTDLVVAFQRSSDNALCLEVFLSDGTGGFTNAGVFVTGDVWDTSHIQFFAVDANGDGRTDVVEAFAHNDPAQGELLYFRSYLSQFGDDAGAMFTTGIVSPTSDPARPTNPIATWCMDTNGDSMMDIVRVWQRGSDQHIIATAYLSVCTSLYQTAFTQSVESDLGTFSLQNLIGFQPVDVNGDGVQDLLEIWQEPGPGTTTLHLTTFLCNGAGGFVAGPDSVFPDQSLTSSEFFPMDVDGHGLTAIVGKWISGNDRLMFTVYRASMSGQYRAGVAFDAGVAGSAVEGAGFFPADVNGDGKADLVRSSLDQNQQPMLVPYVSVGAFPDQAASITNPLGGTVTLQYAPLSDGTVYSAGQPGTFPAAQGRRFPHSMTPAQFPAQAVLGRATYVVSQYTQTNDGQRNRFAYSFTTRMTYSGAQLDLLGRGWQGFRTIGALATDTGSVTVRTFNQGFPFTGTVDSIGLFANGAFATDPRVPKNATALPMSSTSFAYDSVQRAAGVSGTPIVEVLRKTSFFRQYDYGTFDSAMSQAFQYDDFGNETRQQWLGYVDPNSGAPLDPAEVVYRHRLYQNDVTADGWALGFLLWSKDSANETDPDITRFAPGDYHLQGQVWSQGTYNLVQRSAWDSANGGFLATTYVFDEYGNRISETAPGNHVTRYDFDPDYHAFQMRTTSPPNAQGVSLIETFGYDPRYGVQVAHRDANGFVTVDALDGFGRVIANQGPLPGSGTVADPNRVSSFVTGAPDVRAAFTGAAVVTLEQTTFTTDGHGGQYRQTATLESFPTGAAREFVWHQQYLDGLGRERENVRQSGQSAGNAVTLTSYERDGHITSRSLPFFSPTSIVSAAPDTIVTRYDVIGRPIVQNTPAGPDGHDVAVTTWTYSTGGQVTQVDASGSPSAYTQLFVHHVFYGTDKVIRATLDPAGANATTRFQYDPVGRLLTTTDPHGVVTNMTCDSFDRRLTFDTADQNTTGNTSVKAMTYTYDRVTGWLDMTTDASGATTRLAYDALGRTISKVTSSDGRSFSYTYDNAASKAMNQLAQVSATLAGGSVESQYIFGYDPYGNAAATSVSVAGEEALYVTGSVFDPRKRLVQQTYPDSTVLARTYSFGVMVAQSLDGASADYPLEQYDPWQKAGVLQFGTDVRTAYTFNPSGQVIGESVGAAAGNVLHYDYSYDLSNQLLAETDLLDASRSQSFGYENRRLVKAQVPGFESSGSYGYDAGGNLQSKDGVSFSYQAHYPISGVSGGAAVYSASYDPCGRTSSRTIHGTTYNFAYDGLGFLSTVRNATGQTVRSMVSNYLGRLLRQTAADGTVTLYINPSFLVTRAAGASTITKYLLDDRGTAASIVTDGAAKEILYFRRDFKGSNTHAFDAVGALVSQFAYDGYGRVLTVSGGDIRPKYEQREWDADLGLYYFGARYYDVFTGRFLTPDTRLGADDMLRVDVLNRFAFELNNPINNIDPTGHSVGNILAGIGIGLAFLALAALVVVTAGTATPLAAAAVGGLVGAGLNSIIFTATHTDDEGKRFWSGFAVSAAVGFAIGAATGYGGAQFGARVVDVASESIATRMLSAGSTELATKATVTLARMAMWGAYGAATTSAGDTFNQFMSNVADKELVGKQDVSLDDGLGRAAATGAIMGAVAGIGQSLVELRYLRVTRGTLAEEPVSSVDLDNLGARATASTRLLPRANVRISDTTMSRAMLFTVSTSSLAVDASLEAAGY
jgi:RHS repeat-associated protein